MTRFKPAVQDFASYTSEDFRVWRTLFTRQKRLLGSKASSVYLECTRKAGFSSSNIPSFVQTSRLLSRRTGWVLKVAPELVPQEEFFRSLAQKVFPATCWLRTLDELDYLEEPDMFHDVFGHVPLLMDHSFALFVEGFAKLVLKWLDVPEAVRMLGNFYWFTVEFGLIREGNAMKAYGAGILSSRSETLHCLSRASVRPFDVVEMLCTAYRTDVLQEQYFVVDSFEQLYLSLEEVENSFRKVLEHGAVEV